MCVYIFVSNFGEKKHTVAFAKTHCQVVVAFAKEMNMLIFPYRAMSGGQDTEELMPGPRDRNTQSPNPVGGRLPSSPAAATQHHRLPTSPAATLSREALNILLVNSIQENNLATADMLLSEGADADACTPSGVALVHMGKSRDFFCNRV